MRRLRLRVLRLRPVRPCRHGYPIALCRRLHYVGRRRILPLLGGLLLFLLLLPPGGLFL